MKVNFFHATCLYVAAFGSLNPYCNRTTSNLMAMALCTYISTHCTHTRTHNPTHYTHTHSYTLHTRTQHIPTHTHTHTHTQSYTHTHTWSTQSLLAECSCGKSMDRTCVLSVCQGKDYLV